jgi:predicted RNA binding protein YcfA (HicA-like mRNA interferase family)
MGSRPQLTGREVIRKLREFGFEKDRQRGSHVVMRHSDGRSVSVPVHGSKPIKKRTLNNIIRQSGIDQDEFWNA